MTTVDYWQRVQQLMLCLSACVKSILRESARKLKSAPSAKFDRSQRCRKENIFGVEFFNDKQVKNVYTGNR